MQRLLLLLFACFFSLTGLHAQSAPPDVVVEQVVAVLGNEIVLMSDLEKQLAYIKQQQQGQLPPDARCQVLNSILMEKLLIHQAKLDSIEVSDEEVRAQLDARIERILGMMGNDQSQFVAYYGQTPAEMKDFMYDDMKSQILAERMRQKILENATITPSEVIDFFNQIPKDSIPYFNAEVEYSELVYKPQVSQEAKDAAYLKISNIRKQLTEQKADFEALAKKYSDDPGSAAHGGDLGWQKRGTFVPEFEAVAYNLEENEISPVVETQFGYHILQLIGRRGNLIRVRHILVKPVFSEDDYARARHFLDSLRQQIVAGKITFEEAVKKYGDKDQPSYANGGRVTNPYTGSTRFEVADLDFNIYFALDSLQPGQISPPVEFLSDAGEKYYRLLQLNARTQPHRASLETDYARIQQAALNAKKSKTIAEWVEAKKPTVFVHIKPEYLQQCPILRTWTEPPTDNQ